MRSCVVKRILFRTNAIAVSGVGMAAATLESPTAASSLATNRGLKAPLGPRESVYFDETYQNMGRADKTT